ncbi:MAG: alanine racemase [Sphingomonadaceae bacterium]|nr:alanine racemase [Sphingomonadaceae bacterium]
MLPDALQPEPPAGALRLELDSHALRCNWKTLDCLSGTARAAAAVKADGYGLGARQVVPILREAGCEDFLVAHFSELPDIVGLIDPARVSVLHGPLNPQDVAYAVALGVKPVINSPFQARLWRAGGGGACDVMIDTGINRLGIAMSDLGDADIRALDVDILMSHLACADEDSALNELQRKAWEEARTILSHVRASLANSAGIVLGSGYHGDMTRPGLSLYGGIPRPELANRIEQVVHPQAALLQVRSIDVGDGVGYSSTFIADRPMRIGTIAMGYADGFLHCWSDKGLVTAGGKRLRTLGRVSMDMTVIDLTDAPELAEGDWVEAEYDLPNAAAATGLSQYELLTVLGKRFSRNC